MNNIFNYTKVQLEEYFLANNLKKYHATSIFRWIYKKDIRDFTLCSDLSAAHRQILLDNFTFFIPKIVKFQESEDLTIKLLLEMENNDLVECVMMPYSYGNVICVSSQVGCNMGCQFCASGLIKKQRNLSAGEMVAQVQVVNDLLKQKGKSLTHIVIMGTGEPFDNYIEVMKFINIVNDPHGLEIGARHISVSTSGLVDKIIEFADQPLQVNLAISLHATTNHVRDELMKVNKAYPIEKLLSAIDYYLSKNNRKVTIEYILIDQVNDSLEDAKRLVEMFKHRHPILINLIPLNIVEEKNYRPSKQKEKFYQYLKKAKMNVTFRHKFGDDIDAACGQLRRKFGGSDK